MRERFTAPLKSAGGSGHFVKVPAKVVAALGGKGRTPVLPGSTARRIAAP
ncbi:MAG: DUF1905 domain-containing protein [Actinomycetota bacterium]